MLKFVSIVVMAAFMLIFQPLARAIENAGSGNGSEMSDQMINEDYGSQYGTVQAPVAQTDIVGGPSVKRRKHLCPYDQGLAKGAAEREWNRNDDLPGPIHNGLEPNRNEAN
ncbi:MAG: hypothetical protein WAN11_10680 [Syntrophobacteraceae bacterium]